MVDRCFTFYISGISLLRLTDTEMNGDSDLTAEDYRMLSFVCGDDGALFWLRIEAVFLFTTWGHRLSGWLHGCICHEKQLIEGVAVACCYKGRRAAEFAGTACHDFEMELRNLRMPQVH